MSHDLLFNMADQACVRAWEDEGWGPFHKRLLTMCIKIENPGRRKVLNTDSDKVLKHLTKVGSISMREAMDDYGMAGNALAANIATLRKAGHKIVTQMKKHPITGRKYARYKFISAAAQAA